MPVVIGVDQQICACLQMLEILDHAILHNVQVDALRVPPPTALQCPVVLLSQIALRALMLAVIGVVPLKHVLKAPLEEMPHAGPTPPANQDAGRALTRTVLPSLRAVLSLTANHALTPIVIGVAQAKLARKDLLVEVRHARVLRAQCQDVGRAPTLTVLSRKIAPLLPIAKDVQMLIVTGVEAPNLAMKVL